jgi:hypothetical protein
LNSDDKFCILVIVQTREATMEKRVKYVFIGLSLLFLAAGMFLLYYGDKYFPSGKILGIPLSFWKGFSFVSAGLVNGAQRFVEWYSRRD